MPIFRLPAAEHAAFAPVLQEVAEELAVPSPALKAANSSRLSRPARPSGLRCSSWSRRTLLAPSCALSQQLRVVRVMGGPEDRV